MSKCDLRERRHHNDNSERVGDPEENGNHPRKREDSGDQPDNAAATKRIVDLEGLFDQENNDTNVNNHGSSKGASTISVKIRPNLQVVFERRSSGATTPSSSSVTNMPSNSSLQLQRAGLPVQQQDAKKNLSCHPDELTPMTSDIDRSIQGTQSVPSIVETVTSSSAVSNAAPKEIKSRPVYLRSNSRKSMLVKGHSRLKLTMTNSKSTTFLEPEIEEMPSDDEDGDELTELENEELFQARRGHHGKGTNVDRSNSIFCTRDKLERGTISAFKREARHIIERDLPHISHRDNIIRVWADKGQAQLRGLASKHISLFSMKSELQFKYFFQHPYLRLFVSYFVIFCNFLVFAEDPVSHSKMEADIPVVGNVFSFVINKYPPDWRWRFLKVVMWLLAVGCGMVVGKTLIHGIILSRFLRLKMFRADQGSWMVQFLTVIVSLYLFSHAYNVLLVLTYSASRDYTISSKMGVTNSSLMKAAACGTWLGDLITALIVTDMMLQDNLYPNWAPSVRKVWRNCNALRICVFWFGSVLVTSVVIAVIATDIVTWDRLNRDFVSSTELTRALLCSLVLVMDLTIVMQDWDFPHFTNTLDVNLPGFYKHMVDFQSVELQISGKWFNYGIIFLVMIFDLNMWKNQIFYYPDYYGQYTAGGFRVYTVTDQSILLTGNSTLWSFEARATINPDSGIPYMDEDIYMNSKYMGYSMGLKSMAFIPCILGFIVFFTLVGVYGRISKEQRDEDDAKFAAAASANDAAAVASNATAATSTGSASAAASSSAAPPTSAKDKGESPSKPQQV